MIEIIVINSEGIEVHRELNHGGSLRELAVERLTKKYPGCRFEFKLVY